MIFVTSAWIHADALRAINTLVKKKNAILTNKKKTHESSGFRWSVIS